MTYYLHTLAGEPAGFVPGIGICFANPYGKGVELCRSLKEIRQQQRQHKELCRVSSGYTLGYRRVRTPDRRPA